MKGDGMVTPRQSQIISQIIKAERTMPDDFFAVAVIQLLAEIVERYEAVMTQEHLTMAIGVGAYIQRTAKAEMAAEIGMKMAIQRARSSK